MSNLETDFYKAKASGDSAAFAKAKKACIEAGYHVSLDGHLSATEEVKGAPAAPDAKKKKALFGGDAKGNVVTKEETMKKLGA